MPVCLHTHSWYSLREGVASLTTLLDRATAAGYSALALTDTNNLCGAVPFVEDAVRRGLRPFLGATLRQGDVRAVALIESPTGYQSLCRILSRLHLRAAPPGAEPPETQTDGSLLRDLLTEQAAGLHLLVEDIALAEVLRDVYYDRLWFEIVRPGRSPRHEANLLAASRRLGIRPLASPAARLATPDDYPTYRLVAAQRRLLQIDQLPADLDVGPGHHVPTLAEFHRCFRDLPQALRATDDLADLLRSDVLPRERILPNPHDQPGGLDHLRQLCERGLRDRLLGADLAARQRLREELRLIAETGLAGYFLTVHEITRQVRADGHTMALRGSAGNSLVCYLLGITDVNPLRFGLTLERFLHAGRVDLPDIDLDFDWKVRDVVIDRTIQRYGSAHAARICTHQMLQPRSAFREAAKLHGLSNEQISQLLLTLDRRVDEMIDSVASVGRQPHDSSLRMKTLMGLTPHARQNVPRAFPLEPARWPRLLADAARLLGRPDHLSLHPGGIVMTPTPLEEHVPLQWAAKGVVVTQLEKDGVERIGLVKIDLLGNRALATVDEARRIVERTDEPPLHDPATEALLERGDTLGIAQLESPAMRHLLLQMRARSLDDVILALALLRPGAAGLGVKERFLRRRLGLDALTEVHPRLLQILPEGHGLMIYEDDALRLIRALTGLAAAPADFLRKRIAKHQTDDEARQLRAEFLARCHQGPRPHLPPALLDELWDHLSKFNRYSFCKSHAVSYGLIAWHGAYLKAHHPLAFWTAALNNNQGSYARWVHVEAIRNASLTILPPCINRSADTFGVEGEAIRTGLGAIAGLAREVRQRLLDERAAGGPFRHLADFRHRVEPGPEALALLIRAGALDGFGLPRPMLFLQARQPARREPRGPELFDGLPPAPDWQPRDFDLKRRLRDQWQTLGFVLDVPLMDLLRPKNPGDRGPPVIASIDLPRHRGRLVRVQGLVATARLAQTSEGRPLQFVSLRDAHGLAEVTLFDGECPVVPYLTLGPYTATGIVEEQYGVFTLTCRAFEPASIEQPPTLSPVEDASWPPGR